ncbi:MAG: sugar ABC transporter permease [Bauldia sp.]|nr:sugar ABC transporter permease [Bauldia sp.]
MLQQILYAGLMVAIAIAIFIGYFWGANWLLDRMLVTAPAMGQAASTRRDRLRTRIRPWLFIAPALIFLTVYLVYPVFETLRLSLFDRLGQNFVWFRNYEWAFGDPVFWQSALNNLGWLLIVPALCVAFGLLVAVLADRVWWGGVAKTLIFMPMAISFVGASVIWRFVYAYRAEDQDQIGILNAIVTAFGGEPQAWLQIPFLNSFLLMVILIWIQTGFAMVILSAALRGIPQETIEAARIDGANEVQIFFTIMIPQIAGTILVVWTTITIIVLKVFDIVYAMTNGEFDTQVLANLMYRWTFISGDTGRGSAIAIILMIAVLPVMIWNIRRARMAEATH